ncbi:MAG: PRD domain-containing protein [Spirochaetaceae bacterium]|jgi:mannitol operon transcriptional antiterminator|nr:PRD domain-containing protein [Spirochaetaceae bacterium]
MKQMEKAVSLLDLSPRLLRVLELLLRSDEPVKIDTLASVMGTSRRTVFRELENADPVLSVFGAALVSIPGKGIAFSGNGEVRQKLLETMAEYKPQPASKKERLLRLLIELIAHSGEVQKLFYYASSLEVSESTVSNDLDELETWFTGRGLSVMRKSGLGVQCDGTEEVLRTALVSRFMLDGNSGGKSYTSAFGFPGEDIEAGVREILRRKNDLVDWTTPDSFCLISLYLMVMVVRVKKGKSISNEQDAAAGAFQNALAEELAMETEKEFSIRLAETERQALSGWIQVCRSKQESPLEPVAADQLNLIQYLTMQMIDRFDPLIAAILKTNEQLTKFLSRHLESALPRLKGAIELPNPLETELVKNYPEVYEKTCRAAKVLEEYLGFPIPSHEISFIQIHFLAALTVMGERNIRRRSLRAGIVCVSGIGTSYMLAYQVRKRFKGELEVEVSGYDEKDSWADADFLISTIPLTETDKPIVRVQTILGEEDYQKIQDAIKTFAFTERKVELPVRSAFLEKRLDDLIEIFMQARRLLDNFAVVPIRADCSFDELIHFAAARFSSENPQAIYQALAAREALATQIVYELGIILLHTRGVDNTSPVFAVIVPEGGLFTEDYLKNIKSCILMLLPEKTPKAMIELMGRISSALIDMPLFLEAVKAGNREIIQAVLEKEISYLLAQCGGKLVY